MSRDPQGAGAVGTEPSVPQTAQGTAQGESRSAPGQHDRQQNILSRLSSDEATRVTQGWGQSPGTGGDACREAAERTGRAGWAEAAGTDSNMPPDGSSGFPGWWRGAPGPHSRATGLRAIPPPHHRGRSGTSQPPRCLVRPVLLETGSGDETDLLSTDAGGDSPSGCW